MDKLDKGSADGAGLDEGPGVGMGDIPGLAEEVEDKLNEGL